VILAAVKKLMSSQLGLPDF